MGVRAKTHHAHAAVERSAHTHQSCARVFEAAGEHTEHSASVLMGVGIGNLEGIAEVLSFHDAHGGLNAGGGFRHAQGVELYVAGVLAVDGSER